MANHRFLLLPIAALLAAVLAVGCESAGTPSEWSQTYGGSGDDICRSVQTTPDSGYILTGTTQSYGFGEDDVYLVRLNRAGDTLWTRAFGGTDVDIGYSGRQTPDGGYILAGGTTSFSGRNQAYLVKVDAAGNETWSKTPGDADETEYATSVRPTSDGGCIVTGWTSSASGGALLVKCDALGDTLWYKVKGSQAVNEYGAAVEPTADGGYLLIGTTYEYDANGDVWLAKTDANGNDAWEQHFGGAAADVGNSVQPAADGGCILTGTTQSSGAGGSDLYLVKTDASGTEVWTRTFGGSSDDGGSAVSRTADGGYIVAGFTYSYGAGGSDLYLVKTDADGNEEWYNTFGGTADDNGMSVQQTPEGGYIAAGSTQSSGEGGWDFLLVKTDADGNIR